MYNITTTQKQVFIERESFKHKLAKELLSSWLINAEKNRTRHGYCHLAQFGWKKSAGIFPELKFCEHSNVYFFENISDTSGKILFIPDITVFHKGAPLYLFEIVHKSPPSFDKLICIQEFFHDSYVELHTINADYLLNQIQIPSVIKTKQLI